jgi:uncharacterized protein (TIGR03435 family)
MPIALVLAASFSRAQTTENPAFAAADVHASKAVPNPFFDSSFRPNGLYQLHNATMADLIKTAWGVETEAVAGGPVWLDTDRFDINAKALPKSTDAERTLMLRALLMDRFKLAVHAGEKELEVYTLTAGAHGARLQESGAPGDTNCKPDFNEGPPPLITVVCPSMTMADFARQLRRMAGGYIRHPVADLTGLKGAYAITVKWSPSGQAKTNDAGEPVATTSIFDAVDRQLGLKLELTKHAIPIVIVDRVERTPTPNDPEAVKLIPAAETEFEAATLKVNKSGKDIERIQPKPGGRIEVENVPLKDLIGLAWNFDFDSDRIIGLPSWAEKERYDIVAKTAVMPGEQPPPFDDLRLMIRSLLIERFQMKVHDDQQPIKVWTLAVSKRGAKLKDADPSSRSTCSRGASQTGTGSAALPAISYVCTNTTMAQLANALHNIAPGYVDHPAVDMTGIKGAYDFTITWTPRGAVSSGGRGDAKPNETDAASDPSGGITFFDAVEKIGLHLEGGQKHAMPVLVIDHLEPLGPDQ